MLNRQVYFMQQIAALALAFAAFALSGVAATAQTTQPVEITADRFVIKEQQNRAEFSGNVLVTQPDLKVWADRVIVHYGNGGTSDIESFEALTNVKIQNADQTATGDRAVYDPKTRILRLTGNVVVVNDSGVVSAPELIVNLKTDVSEFSTTGGGRVTGVFTPDN